MQLALLLLRKISALVAGPFHTLITFRMITLQEPKLVNPHATPATPQMEAALKFAHPAQLNVRLAKTLVWQEMTPLVLLVLPLTTSN